MNVTLRSVKFQIPFPHPLAFDLVVCGNGFGFWSYFGSYMLHKKCDFFIDESPYRYCFNFNAISVTEPNGFVKMSSHRIYDWLIPSENCPTSDCKQKITRRRKK